MYEPDLCDMFFIASVLFLLVRIGTYCSCSIYLVGLNNWKKLAAGCYSVVCSGHMKQTYSTQPF